MELVFHSPVALPFDKDQILRESLIATSVSVTICVGQYIKSYLERENDSINSREN